MGKLMTEKDVKKKIKVKDLSKLDKSEATEVVGMLQKIKTKAGINIMDKSKEVWMAIKDFLLEVKSSSDFALKSSDENHKTINENFNKEIDKCLKLMDDESLSFEEKKFLIEKTQEIQKMQCNKDSEHLSYKRKFLDSFGKTVTAIGGTVVVVLIAIGLKNKK